MGKKEKRKHPRFKENRYAALKLFRGKKVVNDQIFSVLVDLSLGGCRVRCPSELEIGATVILDIGFEEEIHSFKGKVRHCGSSHFGGWDVGIEFVELSKEKSSFLKKLLQGYVSATKKP